MQRVRTPAAAAGFQLVEVTVVLLLVSILSVWGAPNLRGYQSKAMMRTAARHLISDLRSAQQRAVATGLDHYVMFSRDPNGLVRGYTLREGVTKILRQVTLPDGVRLQLVWPGDAIVFTPLGSVRDPGGTSSLCLDAGGGDGISASINLFTGRVQTAAAASCPTR